MTLTDSSLGAALCNTSQCCVCHPEMSGEMSCLVLDRHKRPRERMPCALMNRNIIWVNFKHTKRWKHVATAGCVSLSSIPFVNKCPGKVFHGQRTCRGIRGAIWTVRVLGWEEPSCKLDVWTWQRGEIKSNRESEWKWWWERRLLHWWQMPKRLVKPLETSAGISHILDGVGKKINVVGEIKENAKVAAQKTEQN